MYTPRRVVQAEEAEQSMATTAHTFLLSSIFSGVAEHIRDWLVGFEAERCEVDSRCRDDRHHDGLLVLL